MTCSQRGCFKPVKARELCSMHYSRWQRDQEPWLPFETIEPPPATRGCNARDETGDLCGTRVEWVRGGVFASRRLCSRHRSLYRDHDLILRRIRSL